MAIQYPDYLPPPLREGYGLQTTSPLQRTRMDSGRVRQRRRFSSVPTTASVSWLLDALQAQMFEAWFLYTLLDGELWFDCELMTPLGLKPYEARFSDIYDGPMLVGVSSWRYSAAIEIRERQTLSREDLELAEEFHSYFSTIDRAVNETWPADFK